MRQITANINVTDRYQAKIFRNVGQIGKQTQNRNPTIRKADIR
jgi:hypothetical protein